MEFLANPYAFFMFGQAYWKLGSNKIDPAKCEGVGVNMLDLIYVLIGIVLFVACWAFTKACDRL